MIIAGRESAKRTNPEPASHRILDTRWQEDGKRAVVSRVGGTAISSPLKEYGQVGSTAKLHQQSPNYGGDTMKYLIALWLAATATMSYAACTYNTYCSNGQCVYCTTCCYGGNCNTTCN